MSSKQYHVYILSNHSRTLYVGVTSDLTRRLFEHKTKLREGFSKRYNVTELVYWEATGDVRSAIAREKQIKSWTRRKRVALINTVNPLWRDLAVGWF